MHQSSLIKIKAWCPMGNKPFTEFWELSYHAKFNFSSVVSLRVVFVTVPDTSRFSVKNHQIYVLHRLLQDNPDSKVHGANMGPTWVLSAPDGPHFGPMNIAIRVNYLLTHTCHQITRSRAWRSQAWNTRVLKLIWRFQQLARAQFTVWLLHLDVFHCQFVNLTRFFPRTTIKRF